MKREKNAALQGHRVPPEQKRIEKKGGKQRRCGGGQNTEGMLINKILLLDECRDSGLPLLRALSNLWDGSNKARLCGWEAREGEPKRENLLALSTTASDRKTTSWISCFFFSFLSLSPSSLFTQLPTTRWAATAARQATHSQMSGDKMDLRDLLELQGVLRTRFTWRHRSPVAILASKGTSWDKSALFR